MADRKDGGADYNVTLNLYQLAGLRGVVAKEVAAVERHTGVNGGDHREYLDQLRGCLTAIAEAQRVKP